MGRVLFGSEDWDHISSRACCLCYVTLWIVLLEMTDDDCVDDNGGWCLMALDASCISLQPSVVCTRCLSRSDAASLCNTAHAVHTRKRAGQMCTYHIVVVRAVCVDVVSSEHVGGACECSGDGDGNGNGLVTYFLCCVLLCSVFADALCVLCGGRKCQSHCECRRMHMQFSECPVRFACIC